MPWKEVSTMSQRLEFVTLASAEQANRRHLCRSFGISPTTGYKWLDRFHCTGSEGLQEQSRRPHHSPARTTTEIEEAVLNLRLQHPAWGGRKLRHRLLAHGHPQVPSASTITAILKRHHLIAREESRKHQAFHRFEHAAPNDLWQMDFKGDFALAPGRCYPLTVLDDHSRFALAICACSGPTTVLTKAALSSIFRRYGLPHAVTCDNGPPWGASAQSRYTELSVWLLRLGIRVAHSRPSHPQTQGKDERFHRTLKAEVLRYHAYESLAQWQAEFDRWRLIYNCERPHEALAMNVPASRYQPSRRVFPEQLPKIEYGPSDSVRKVRGYGHIKYEGREYHVGKAFRGLHVALRHTMTDGLLDVYFCQHKISSIDLRCPST